MKKKLSIIMLVVLVAISVIGNKTTAKADNYKGPLFINIQHVSSQCCPDTSDLYYHPGENHLFYATVTDGDGNDVTDQYVVEWSLSFPDGVSSACASITIDGNNCVLSAVSVTDSEWDSLLIAQIHDGDEELGFGLSSYRIVDGDAATLGDPESLLHPIEASASDETITEEMVPVSEGDIDDSIIDSPTGSGENVEENSSKHTPIAIGTCVAAVVLCGAGAAVIKKKKSGK